MLPIRIDKFLYRPLKDLIISHMNLEDIEKIDDFGLWAFGDGYKEFDHSYDFLKAWNQLHGKDLMLEDEGVPGEDIPKMIELWKKE